MYRLTIESTKGEKLEFGFGSPFQITEIEGLNPPEADINVSEMALLDGRHFNSAKLQMRTMNIAFAIDNDAARNRIRVYRVLQTKSKVRVAYQSDYRDVYIEGYVSGIQIGYFEMKQVVTVMIVCPSPYFLAAQEIVNEVSATIRMFHFAFGSTSARELVFGYIDPTANVVVSNNGEAEAGLVFELYAMKAVSNPKIFDYMSGDYFGLNIDMQAADLITVSTLPGAKTAKLLRNGTETNVFNNIMKGSTWLQLPIGGGVYTYEVGTGEMADLDITIRHYDMFEGV